MADYTSSWFHVSLVSMGDAANPAISQRARALHGPTYYDPLFVPRFPLIQVFPPWNPGRLSRCNGFWSKARSLFCFLQATLSRCLFRSLNKTHVIWRAVRSCLFHIHIQPSTDILVEVGVAMEHHPHLGWVEAPRTACRKSHIEKLKGLHPSLDRVDLRLFLAGFDAGEEFASRSGIGNSASTSQSSSD